LTKGWENKFEKKISNGWKTETTVENEIKTIDGEIKNGQTKTVDEKSPKGWENKVEKKIRTNDENTPLGWKIIADKKIKFDENTLPNEWENKEKNTIENSDEQNSKDIKNIEITKNDKQLNETLLKMNETMIKMNDTMLIMSSTMSKMSTSIEKKIENLENKETNMKKEKNKIFEKTYSKDNDKTLNNPNKETKIIKDIINFIKKTDEFDTEWTPQNDETQINDLAKIFKNLTITKGKWFEDKAIKDILQFLESTKEFDTTWQPTEFKDLIQTLDKMTIHEKNCLTEQTNFLRTTTELLKPWKQNLLSPKIDCKNSKFKVTKEKSNHILVKPQKFPVKVVPRLKIKLKMNKPKITDKINNLPKLSINDTIEKRDLNNKKKVEENTSDNKQSKLLKNIDKKHPNEWKNKKEKNDEKRPNGRKNEKVNNELQNLNVSTKKETIENLTKPLKNTIDKRYLNIKKKVEEKTSDNQQPKLKENDDKKHPNELKNKEKINDEKRPYGRKNNEKVKNKLQNLNVPTKKETIENLTKPMKNSCEITKEQIPSTNEELDTKIEKTNLDNKDIFKKLMNIKQPAKIVFKRKRTVQPPKENFKKQSDTRNTMKNLFPMAEKRKIETDFDNINTSTKRRKIINTGSILTKNQNNSAEKAVSVVVIPKISSKAQFKPLKQGMPVKKNITRVHVTSSQKFGGKSLHVTSNSKTSPSIPIQ